MISTVTFTRNLTTKTGRITDTTDYAALGIDLEAYLAKGLGTITFQGDIIVQKNSVGDPLIDLESGATYYEFPLELDSLGNVANGVYTLTYSLRLLSNPLAPIHVVILSETPPDTVTTDGDSWLADFLEAGNEITLTGGGPNLATTVVSASVSGDNTDIVVADALDPEAPHDDIAFDITNETFAATWTFTDCTLVDGCATFSYDCQYGQNGTWSVSNATNLTGLTLVSLTGKIFWPSLTERDPIDITSLPYSSNQLAYGSYSINFTQVLQEVATDGLITQYSTNYINEFDPVICTSNICGLMKCFASLQAAHIGALNASKVSQYQTSFDAAVGYIEQYNAYMSCADNNAAQTALNNLKSVLDDSGCDCGCTDCNDESQIWVNNYLSISVQPQWLVIDGVPDANFDAAHGYGVSSIVIDSNTNIAYICTNPANGSAVWEVYLSQAYRVFDGVPGVNEDETLGIQVGYIIQNYNTGIEYRCTDNTEGAATWEVYYNPAGGVAYTTYVALLDQSGTDAPTAIVLANTTGETFTWTRDDVGIYTVTTSGSLFDENTTFVVMGQDKEGKVVYGTSWVSDTQFLIYVRDLSETLVDGYLQFTSIEFRIYA